MHTPSCEHGWGGAGWAADSSPHTRSFLGLGVFRLHPQLTLARRGCSAPASLAISLSESLKSSGESQKVTAPRAGLGVGRAWTSETSGPLQLSSPEPGPELRTPITAEPS